jgi:hypothetical protein
MNMGIDGIRLATIGYWLFKMRAELGELFYLATFVGLKFFITKNLLKRFGLEFILA